MSEILYGWNTGILYRHQSKKVHCGNIETHYLMSKRKDIAQKKRSMMIGDRYMALPFLDKNTLYEETMRDKKRTIESGIVYADSISIGSCEILSYSGTRKYYRSTTRRNYIDIMILMLLPSSI